MEADRHGPGPEIRSLRLTASLSLTPQASRRERDVTIVDALKLVVGRDLATLRAHLSEHLGKQRGLVYARQREPWRRLEMRHWNPEAHIGDDGYVLADVKAARGANAPRPGQRGANAPRPAQQGAIAPRPAQRGANTRRPAQRNANARPAQRGANAARRQRAAAGACW
eukprot:jgi/Tetstr1/462148/TSEL_007213.t1